jgi:uncharacterized SAM-binding protein YcdF (DUF218 family)
MFTPSPNRSRFFQRGSADSASRSAAHLRLRLLIIGVCGVILLLLLVIGEVARLVAPRANTSRTHFDVILVLGTPTDSDGLPTARQQARVREAVREYDLGMAPVILFSGGATRPGHVEADAMGEIARSLGIPPSQILLERKAENTIENACYSIQRMQAHKWHSAEVIGSAEQIPRAGLIFQRFPIEFATHAAPSTEQPPAIEDKFDAVREMLKTSRFLLFGRILEPCLP